FIATDSTATYQINDATMIAVGDGASLDHVRLMEDTRQAANIATLKTVLGRKANYKVFNLTSGAAVSRYQAMLRFDGEGSRVETYGVNLLNG
ncbi:SufD family Fe-S cluster assembly protein, partial [Raoultella ornithinolytica]|uniref:SufD family Fe-S cluster assembly protein n=1 Tax=Raoultella ornithinolytica TaxID=54291 RepID=UPI0013D9130D